MDKFSYAIGLGIGQNLLSMGAKGIAVDDFAQAIKDVLEGNQTAISHTDILCEAIPWLCRKDK